MLFPFRAMTNKRTPGKKKKKDQKTIPIDCIPKYSQQPRSSPPKRRTDFSLFVCSPPNPGTMNSSSGEVRTSNVTASSLKERGAEGKKFPEGTLIQCSDSPDGRLIFTSKFVDVPVIKVESVVRGEDYCRIRDASKEKSDTCMELESTPHSSPVSDSDGAALTPGSIVWAKRASQLWWPAEIMQERSTSSDQGCDGHVLVHFYGNHPCAWINPMTDLSTFNDYFEERSSNPSTDFQDALKQALQRKEQLSCREKLSPDRSIHSDQQDHSSDKWASQTSSQTRHDFLERGRGKREKKRKVHFDEVSFPLKSEKRCRRLKIMRYLGLTAPVGSPF